MPSVEVEGWLQSGQVARLAGLELMPIPHPKDPTSPLCMGRSQGEAYGLISPDGTGWILKKFSPRMQPSVTYVAQIAGCVPKRQGFECGFQRVVLGAQEPSTGYRNDDLRNWLTGAILMPRVGGMPWGNVLSGLIDGTLNPANEERVQLAMDLVDTIASLEASTCSHRDLSTGNVFVWAASVHLIDWDALYHPSLPFQANTTVGSLGYLAPWLNQDPQLSWCQGADRFSLAVCVAELLAAGPGVVTYGDGGLLEQTLGNAPTKRSLEQVTSLLQTLGAPDVGQLFHQAVSATTFADCPSPADWSAALRKLLPTPSELTLADLCPNQVAHYGKWMLQRKGDRV
ncbi:MAG: hypothetical protein ACYCOU_20880, partial [Sulfobacillus sp.]